MHLVIFTLSFRERRLKSHVTEFHSMSNVTEYTVLLYSQLFIHDSLPPLNDIAALVVSHSDYTYWTKTIMLVYYDQARK